MPERPVFLALALGAAGFLSVAQAQVAPSDQPIVAVLNRIAQRTARLTPMLDQVHTTEWVAKGAPDTYNAQVATAKQQIGAIQSDMAALTARPEAMQDCMKGLFRVQTFHRSLDSLMGGLRRYQNSALADLILSVAAEDQEDLGKLEQYILDLADQKEKEFRVVDNEAQRCRATISREPGRVPGTSTKR